MIELASLSDPQLVSHAIASALGVQTDQDSSLSSLLIAALRERQVLLLLDNCEPVLTECAPLVEALLQTAPHLYLLGTSREPFGIAGRRSGVWQRCPRPSLRRFLLSNCLLAVKPSSFFVRGLPRVTRVFVSPKPMPLLLLASVINWMVCHSHWNWQQPFFPCSPSISSLPGWMNALSC
jgi:hypothetical protein